MKQTMMLMKKYPLGLLGGPHTMHFMEIIWRMRSEVQRYCEYDSDTPFEWSTYYSGDHTAKIEREEDEEDMLNEGEGFGYDAVFKLELNNVQYRLFYWAGRVEIKDCGDNFIHFEQSAFHDYEGLYLVY